MPSEPTSGETAVRRRTRRAVVDAAVHVWARNWAAPLGVVAEQAGVSRSTLHRYFVDREALVDACLETGREVLAELHDTPVLGDGSPLVHLTRQLEVAAGNADWVLFLWTDPDRFAGRAAAEVLLGEEGPDGTLGLIRAAQEAGELDRDVPAAWLETVFLGLLYSAADAAARGVLPALDAGRLAARALRQGITPSG